MRVGIISDPHGNVFGLTAVLAALDEAGVETVVCAGDIVGYYPFVNETIDALRSRDVTCIAGNHDLYLRGDYRVDADRWQAYHLDYVDEVISPDNRRWLASLPLELELEFDGARILICHGSPWSPEEYIYPNGTDFSRFESVNADVIVMGHTHIPFQRRVGVAPRDVLLFNPGSCGQPRDYIPLAALGILDTRTRQATVERVAYDIDTVRARCHELHFGSSVCDILVRTK